MTRSGQPSFKVVLLGEGRVGKTSLISRYVKNEFPEETDTTTQATFLTKNVNVGRRHADLQVWDTAGQERFHALGPIYYRDADAAILVYDIADRRSFTMVRNWVKELRKVVGTRITIFIAANKCDLERSIQVSWEDADEYAQSIPAPLVRTSARSGKGVENLFLEVTKSLLRAKDQSTSSHRKTILESDDDAQKVYCCT